MRQQGVDKRSVRIAGCGVDDHSRWFVDNEQVIIFIPDVEGNILRNDCRRRGFRYQCRKGFAGFDPIRSVRYRPFAGAYGTGFDQRFQPGPGQRRECFGKQPVEAISGIVFFNRMGQWFLRHTIVTVSLIVRVVSNRGS